MNGSYRVLIADDHAITRQGIRLIAESIDGIEVVGEAETGREVLDLQSDLRPDVVLMDLDMPEMGGVEAIKQLKIDSPKTRVLVLTVDDTKEAIYEAIQAGASGYLSKSSKLDDLRIAFSGLDTDGVYVTPGIARKLIDTVSRKDLGPNTSIASAMTPREREILSLLGDGLSAHRIATTLGIREGTVNTHIGNIYRKLSVNNRVDAVREGMRRHIVELPD